MAFDRDRYTYRSEWANVYGLDSWIEVASQPSSSSLSSAAGDDALTAQDRRVKHDPRSSRRRHHSFRHNRRATSLNIEHRPFLMGGTSSQEEYEESESESDRVMTSSGEIPHHQESNSYTLAHS